MSSSKAEDLELDLSKSEFLTEVDQSEHVEDLRGETTFGTNPHLYRPRSSKISNSLDA